MVQELAAKRTIEDPARPRVVQGRKAVVAGWMRIAEALDRQGEIELAGDVRYFVRRLPTALTDREKLALQYIEHIRSKRPEPKVRSREREELTR